MTKQDLYAEEEEGSIASTENKALVFKFQREHTHMMSQHCIFMEQSVH